MRCAASQLDVYIVRLVEMCGTRVFQGDGIGHEPAYLSNNLYLADFLEALPSFHDMMQPLSRTFSRLRPPDRAGSGACAGMCAFVAAGVYNT